MEMTSWIWSSRATSPGSLVFLTRGVFREWSYGMLDRGRELDLVPVYRECGRRRRYIVDFFPIDGIFPTVVPCTLWSIQTGMSMPVNNLSVSYLRNHQKRFKPNR